MQAIILAAGMGKRLKKLTSDRTKCMVKVNGVTLIERMLAQLDRLLLDKIVLVVVWGIPPVVVPPYHDCVVKILAYLDFFCVHVPMYPLDFNFCHGRFYVLPVVSIFGGFTHQPPISTSCNSIPYF